MEILLERSLTDRHFCRAEPTFSPCTQAAVLSAHVAPSTSLNHRDVNQGRPFPSAIGDECDEDLEGIGVHSASCKLGWRRLLHGLHSGYLTEAANRGIPLPEAMQQSQHKSPTQAAAYYNNPDRKRGRAARLIA